MEPTHIHCVTVPGTAAGWVDSIDRFGSGKMTMKEILAPAIELGMCVCVCVCVCD
jgi:gamma-glutamyltranspeptidase/glutathione hydrolase